jgi:Arc/MetJ family transcription regulator
MKMTVEIDEKRLSRLMKRTGIRTKTRALDYALRLAERVTIRDRLLATPLTADDLAGAVDPGYDLLALRRSDRPRSG